MRELVKLDQEVLIVPKDFKLTNIGKVIDVGENGFKMQVNYPTKGININHICEFFSPTENGMLYFESYTAQMENNILTIANPIKHRFLQRRKFTRIPFVFLQVRELDCTENGNRKISRETARGLSKCEKYCVTSI